VSPADTPLHGFLQDPVDPHPGFERTGDERHNSLIAHLAPDQLQDQIMRYLVEDPLQVNGRTPLVAQQLLCHHDIH
jgi:hypothetical protein